jgi:phosphoribosylaminoimidazole (AIR) synthetase
MHLLGALGGLEEDELRATFNGGVGMTAIVAPEAVPSAMDAFTAQGIDPLLIGEVAPADELGGRYVEGPLERFR